MTYTVGSLVKARGREWVVLPDSTDDLLVLRPLGGSDDEIAGIYIPLEPVTPATFDLPDPHKLGIIVQLVCCAMLSGLVFAPALVRSALLHGSALSLVPISLFHC